MTDRPALHLRIGLRGTGVPRIEDLTPHAPPALMLLRAMPGCDPEPPDRQPSSRRPRHWARGVSAVAVTAWVCAVWAALGTAAWALHWLIVG